MSRRRTRRDIKDVVTGSVAGLKIAIAPGLCPGSWTKFKACDAQPSGLRFRRFSFCVNALPDAPGRLPIDC
jgi:hypothetical protein